MSLQHLIRSSREIQSIRESGAMLAETLRVLKSALEPTMSTFDIDEIARREIKSLGGKPSFYGYHGFPGAVCTSLNSQIVHGIPSRNVIIQDGDIVSVDCGVTYNGMITDAAFSLIVGQPKEVRHAELLKTTEESLHNGIFTVKDKVSISDVSAAIESTLKTKNYGIIKDLVGHGVGRQLHEEPEIPNYVTKKKLPALLAGMTIAIEPMATLGSDRVTMAADGWTISTADGSLSAHFEHTVLVTKNGAEILTV